MNWRQLLFAEALTTFNLHMNQVSVCISTCISVPLLRSLGLRWW